MEVDGSMQFMSFPGDYEVDRENKKEATTCSLKAAPVKHEGKICTQGKPCELPREVDYHRKKHPVSEKISGAEGLSCEEDNNDLGENKVSKDPSDSLCAQAMQRRIVRNVPATRQFNNIYCPDLDPLSMERASSQL